LTDEVFYGVRTEPGAGACHDDDARRGLRALTPWSACRECHSRSPLEALSLIRRRLRFLFPYKRSTSACRRIVPIIEAGKAEGVLRDDVTIEDFLMVEGAVVLVGPEKGRRLATLLLDGLRHQPRALTPDGTTPAKKRPRGRRRSRR
jgi:hypothetical protein